MGTSRHRIGCVSFQTHEAGDADDPLPYMYVAAVATCILNIPAIK